MFARRFRRTPAAVLVLAGVAGSLALAAPAGAATPPVVAPYFEVTGANPTLLTRAISSAGLTSFTAAFVLGDGCTPTWDDGTAVATNAAAAKRITAARTAGATPTISFGGASGTDLARSCASPASLLTAYSAVIDKFKVRSVDFDVEGEALDDTAGNDARFAAIHALETKYPTLKVSVTLPVAPAGLEADGLAFLKAGKSDGARIDLVNVMTMDYGDSRNMATTAVSSAKGTLAQLKKIWPASTYKNVGITPMIGQNDTPAEVFTIANVATVRTFAKNNGVGRLAFWSLNRDQPCPTATKVAQWNCSGGTTPAALAFTKAFLS